MVEIARDNYIFSVDIQQTEKYYQSNSVCICDDCQYLHSNIRGKYPELEAFLSDFGIDVSNFDEAGPIELDGSYLYTFIGYTVCGKIVNSAGNDIIIRGSNDIKIGVDPGFAFPNSQEGDYFSLMVFGVSLDCETAREFRKKTFTNSFRLKMKSLFGKHT